MTSNSDLEDDCDLLAAENIDLRRKLAACETRVCCPRKKAQDRTFTGPRLAPVTPRCSDRMGGHRCPACMASNALTSERCAFTFVEWHDGITALGTTPHDGKVEGSSNFFPSRCVGHAMRADWSCPQPSLIISRAIAESLGGS